jgi:hypothetical protein
MKVLGPYAYETRVEQFRRGRWSTMMMGKETYSAVGGQGESGGGDGTVRRILGGALMGAMLGGGGQDSVDLAVAGAQAAAQGGNTLEVLNSMGDVAAVKQAESARQLEDTIAQAQAPSPVSAPQASTSEESPRASVQPESSAAADKEDRARADREAADAERQRVAEAARKKAEADKAQRRAEDLAAREKAAAEAKQRREQQTRQDESNLRSSFSGRASTCAGGGSGILYLQTSRPPKLGCNVQFEARCPGTQPGNGTTFGQNNYVGGSCMGIGDAIQIGTMSCPADQVQVQMTGASCS